MATRTRFLLLLLLWVSPAGANAYAQQSDRPVAVLEGAVVTDDAASIPLQNVRVAVTWTGGEAAPVFTDERGRFSVAIAAGVYHTVAVAKAGYAPQRIGREPDASEDPVVVRLAKGGAVTGTIIDTTGTVVPGVAVRVRRTEDGSTYTTGEYQADTDDRGVFRVGSLPTGRYAVTISSAGARPALGNLADLGSVVDVRAGSEVNVVRVHESAAASERPAASYDRFNEGARAELGAAAAGPASVIQGQVFDDTGRPVPLALVRVFSIAGAFNLVTAADTSGRYEIGDVPPGTYRLVAGRREPQPLAMPRDAAGRIVVVGAGERLTRVDLTYRPGGVITGSVVDEHGEPLEGVIVQVLDARRAGGRTEIASTVGARGRRTDDRGEFRVFDLPSGSYYVMAADSTVHGETSGAGHQVAFHPAAGSLGAAVPVVVGPGFEVHASITFTPSSMGRIEGRVFDRAGEPFRGIVRLLPRTLNGRPAVTGRGTQALDGSFSFPNVLPGDYVVHAVAPIGGPDAMRPDPLMTLQFGVAFVSAAADASAPVTLHLSSGSVLQGRLVVEGGAALSPPPRLSVVAVAVDPDLSPVSAARSVAVQPDGTFAIGDLFGPMRLAVDGAGGWRLRSAYVGGTDAADEPVTFGSANGSHADVEIVIARGGATIAGRVTGEAAAGALVAAGPGDPEGWHERSRFVKLTTADRAGAFTLSDLPGGRYIVVAIEPHSLRPGVRGLTPDDIRALLPGAEPLSVAENGRATVDVRVMSLP